MNERRHDLDWLRVFAFGLLILYHVGMVYVDRWGFHYKSAYSSTFLENLMLLANPWRMPLLWMISGIATAYVFRRRGWLGTLRSRTVRLLLPLAFGVWIVVPPQLFVEMTVDGAFSGSYLTFYRHFLDLSDPLFADYTAGIWPHVDVNHLWYLRELWLFTLLLLLVVPLLTALLARLRRWPRFDDQWLDRIWAPVGSASVLFALPALLTVIDLLFLPHLGEDGRREALGLVFLVLGYLMVDRAAVWAALARWRHLALGLALLTYGLFLAGYHLVWLRAGEVPITPFQGVAFTVLDQFNRWFWLAALFGYALTHLNRPHPWLSYLTPAVYPFYIVHQTLIVVLAFSLGRYALGPVIEPTLVLFGTVAGCWLAYELARRSGVLRPLFGLRMPPSGGAAGSDWSWRTGLAAAAATAIALPLGLELIL